MHPLIPEFDGLFAARSASFKPCGFAEIEPLEDEEAGHSASASFSLDWENSFFRGNPGEFKLSGDNFVSGSYSIEASNLQMMLGTNVSSESRQITRGSERRKNWPTWCSTSVGTSSMLVDHSFRSLFPSSLKYSSELPWLLHSAIKSLVRPWPWIWTPGIFSSNPFLRLG